MWQFWSFVFIWNIIILLNYNETNEYKTIVLGPVKTRISRNLKKPTGVAGLIYKMLQISSDTAADKVISFLRNSKKTLHVTLFATIVYYVIKIIIFLIPSLYMKNKKK